MNAWPEMFLEVNSEDSPSMTKSKDAFVTSIAILSTQKMDHALKALKMTFGVVLVQSLDHTVHQGLNATKSRLRAKA
jgi:hypothetical protein